MAKEIINLKKLIAKIVNTNFGLNECHFFSFQIELQYTSGSFQNFGDYVICEWNEEKGRRVGTAGGLDAFLQIVDMFNVNNFNELIGKYCFALVNERGFVVGLKNLPPDGNKRFLVHEWKKEWFEAEGK